MCRAKYELAIARGITGFTIDVMSVKEAINVDRPFAFIAKRRASGGLTFFKIVVMPDISALKADAGRPVVRIVAAVASSPAAYRLDDGRLGCHGFQRRREPARNGGNRSLVNSKSRGHQHRLRANVFLVGGDKPMHFRRSAHGFGDWGNGDRACFGQYERRSGGQLTLITAKSS